MSFTTEPQHSFHHTAQNRTFFHQMNLLKEENSLTPKDSELNNITLTLRTSTLQLYLLKKRFFQSPKLNTNIHTDHRTESAPRALYFLGKNCRKKAFSLIARVLDIQASHSHHPDKQDSEKPITVVQESSERVPGEF